jgi:hypothetical protein
MGEAPLSGVLAPVSNPVEELGRSGVLAESFFEGSMARFTPSSSKTHMEIGGFPRDTWRDPRALGRLVYGRSARRRDWVI